MPRQLWIDDHIEFRGDALHRSNIDGPIQETMAHFHDHFLVDTANLDSYVVSTNGTAEEAAIAVAVGGQFRFKTGSSDKDTCSLATAINWEDDMYARCEARIKIATVANTAIFFGFSDATSESNQEMPQDYDGGSSLTTVASSCAGILVDGDYNSSILAVSCAGSATTPVDSTVDWADGEWHTLRIELKPEKAYYYLDGASFAHINDAVTSGTALTMVLFCETRTTGGKYVYLDRWDAWQNEGE